VKFQIHSGNYESENDSLGVPSPSCKPEHSPSTLGAGRIWGRNDRHSCHGIRRLRPFSRRRFRTSLPAFVLIRLRKPWVFALFLLLGRKVGCMATPAIHEYFQLYWICSLTGKSHNSANGLYNTAFFRVSNHLNRN
jgi:hypothetical protein